MRDESRDSLLPPVSVLAEIAADKELMAQVKRNCTLVNRLVDELEAALGAEQWHEQMIALCMMYAAIGGRIDEGYREMAMELFVRTAHGLTLMSDEITRRKGGEDE